MILKFLPFLFVFLVSLPAVGAENTPVSVVEGFHKDLLTVMKAADKLGVKGRYQYLAPRLAKAFDMSRMIRIATGSFWKKADPNQQKQLLDAFTQMSASTYASQFDGYSGEAFKTLGAKPGPRGTMMVATQILRPNDSPVDITYVVKESGGRWRIVDVLLDNSVSELAVRRSEYRQMLRSRGMKGLIDLLNSKASSLTTG